MGEEHLGGGGGAYKIWAWEERGKFGRQVKTILPEEIPRTMKGTIFKT